MSISAHPPEPQYPCDSQIFILPGGRTLIKAHRNPNLLPRLSSRKEGAFLHKTGLKLNVRAITPD
jgi:hypothetical protein